MKISEVFSEAEQEPQEGAPAQGAQGAPPAAGNPGGQPAAAGGDPNAPTPEEQQAYDGVVMAASEVMYGEMSAEIIKMLEMGKENPPQAIAQAAVTVLVQLDEQSGGSIPETVIVPAAVEIAELMAELADSKGLFPVDEDIIQVAGQYLIELISEEYGVSPEEVQEFMASIPPEEAQKAAGQQMEAQKRAEAKVTGGQPNGR